MVADVHMGNLVNLVLEIDTGDTHDRARTVKSVIWRGLRLTGPNERTKDS